MDKINYLKRVTIFKNLSEEEIRSISEISIMKKFSSKETIFFEGEEASGFYAVINGKVKISKFSSEGKEQILKIWNESNIFGEVAVFLRKNFPANAEALENTETLFFPKDDFIKLISNNPYLSLNMIADLSHRLNKFTSLIENLSLKDVPARLSDYILTLSKEYNSSDFSLDISKTHIASLLGTIPETLSRIFTKMKDKNLIKINGSNIKIIDKLELEKLSRSEFKL